MSAMNDSRRDKRESFRHGNLPEALVAAALVRLEAEGPEGVSLRDLSRDVGVDHRAIYRHFPDRLALMARVAEEGWGELEERINAAVAARNPGERTLVEGGVALFVFAREHPNLFALMGGPQLHEDRKFPGLDRAIGRTLELLRQGFIGAGTGPDAAQKRTLIYASALQGVISQILSRRYRVHPAQAEREVAKICEMLIKGLR